MVIPIFGIQAAPSILNLVQPDATLEQHVYLLVAMYTYSGTRVPRYLVPNLVFYLEAGTSFFAKSKNGHSIRVFKKPNLGLPKKQPVLYRHIYKPGPKFDRPP